jgi:hypothetical protein
MRPSLAFKRFVRRLIRLSVARPHWIALACFAPAAIAGCASSLSPRMKLDEAVQDMNTAARFGRIDLATERVAGTVRQDFLKRHRLWGADVRIVDVEIGSVEKMTEKEAVLYVSYSWFRPTVGSLRATTVRQTWKNNDGNADTWALYEEERAGGDVGLLGEPPVVVLKPETPKVRFETTRIPGN